jgi:hypothetical protein
MEATIRENLGSYYELNAHVDLSKNYSFKAAKRAAQVIRNRRDGLSGG